MRSSCSYTLCSVVASTRWWHVTLFCRCRMDSGCAQEAPLEMYIWRYRPGVRVGSGGLCGRYIPLRCGGKYCGRYIPLHCGGTAGGTYLSVVEVLREVRTSPLWRYMWEVRTSPLWRYVVRKLMRMSARNMMSTMRSMMTSGSVCFASAFASRVDASCNRAIRRVKRPLNDAVEPKVLHVDGS